MDFLLLLLWFYCISSFVCYSALFYFSLCLFLPFPPFIFWHCLVPRFVMCSPFAFVSLFWKNLCVIRKRRQSRFGISGPVDDDEDDDDDGDGDEAGRQAGHPTTPTMLPPPIPIWEKRVMVMVVVVPLTHPLGSRITFARRGLFWWTIFNFFFTLFFLTKIV